MNTKEIFNLIHRKSVLLYEWISNNGVGIYINEFVRDGDRCVLRMHLNGPVSLDLDIDNNTAEIVMTNPTYSFTYAKGGDYDRVMASAGLGTRIVSINTKWLYPYRSWTDDSPIYVGRKFDVEWRSDGFLLHPAESRVSEPYYKKRRVKRDADMVDHVNKVLYGEYMRHYVSCGGCTINRNAAIDLFVAALQEVFMKQYDYEYYSELFPSNILAKGLYRFPFADLLGKEVTGSILDALVSYQEEKLLEPDRYANPNMVISFDNVPRIAYNDYIDIYTNKLTNELRAIAARTGVPVHLLLPVALVMGGRIEFGLHEWK